MDPAIYTEALTRRFGARTAVDHLDLEVYPGEIFGFLGPNGAGKTTTINMLLGLLRPSAGRAVVLGHDIQRAPAEALRSVGALAEVPAFYPYLSGRDNLRVLARAGGLPDRRVDEVLAIVELSTPARQRFKSYSLGMRQRLGLAAALLHDPRLLILDEPTNGLDPAGQIEIRSLIRTLAESGRTVFLSSHMLHEVEQLCERVAILKQGKIIARGRVADLLRRGQGVVLRVAGDPQPAISLLRDKAGITEITCEGDALLIDVPIERAAEINTLLATHQIAVAELRAHEERLEDFFMEITRA